MKKEKLYYFESEVGCGIRSGKNEDEVEQELREEIGDRIDIVQEATKENLDWVKNMQGYIPTK